MSLEVLATTLFIFVARVVDVSLGTLRTVSVVRGRRTLAFGLGFVEMLVWVTVVSKVVTNLQHPAYVIAFAFGFAAGTTVGISLEQWFAMGQQVIRVFTSQGSALASVIRDRGFLVTEFAGSGRDGKVSLLFVQVPRRRMKVLVAIARELDPKCFYTVDDLRLASSVRAGHHHVSHEHLV